MLTAHLPGFALDNATLDEDDNVVNPAVELAAAMNKQARHGGLAGDKHKHKFGQIHLCFRTFIAVLWEKLELIVPTCTFVVKSGLSKKTVKIAGTKKRRTLPHQGGKSHYHLYMHWWIPGTNMLAVQRIACSCEGCYNQLHIVWDLTITDWTKQPRFFHPLLCKYASIFKEFNDWKFVTLAPSPVTTKNAEKKKAKEDLNAKEIQTVLDAFLGNYEQVVIDSVKVGGYAAMNLDDTDGFCLIRWRGEPYALQTPMLVEGDELEEMPIGTIVCEAQYCNRLARNPNWYHFDYRSSTKVFRLQYILEADVQMEPYSNGMVGPPKLNQSGLEQWQTAFAGRDVKRVPKEALDAILKEKQKRSEIDFTEIEWTGRDDDGQAEDSEDEDEEEEEEDIDE
jgi:hypothetical protein